MTGARALIDRIENLGVLDRVSKIPAQLIQRATRPTAVENALSGGWLGHQLHPLLTDLPIGAWAMASVLDWTAGSRSSAAACRLVGVGVLAAVPSAATGASDWSNSFGPGQRVGVVHAVTNLAGTALQAASWVTRRRGHRVSGALLSTVGFAVTACAGYLGGHLTLVRGLGVNNTAFQPDVSAWTDVAAIDSLTDGKPARVDAGGVSVVLVRDGDTVHALSATCVHASGPLDQGALVHDGDAIRCPWHGSTFRLTDGTVVRGPAAIAQPCWDVTVDDGRVKVRSVGDHAA